MLETICLGDIVHENGLSSLSNTHFEEFYFLPIHATLDSVDLYILHSVGLYIHGEYMCSSMVLELLLTIHHFRLIEKDKQKGLLSCLG